MFIIWLLWRAAGLGQIGISLESYWVAIIKPGAVLFEISGLEKQQAYKVLKTASYKLPIRTKILSRETAS